MTESKKQKNDLKILADKLSFETPLVWDKLTENEKSEVEKFAQQYKGFINLAKTERSTINEAVALAKEKGCLDLNTDNFKKGAPGYLIRHNKMVGFFRPGEQALEDGFNLIVTHGDCPRLDLKPKCVYEDFALGMLKTNLYGGLKKHQWLTRPLALWGFCALKDGTFLNIKFGEDENEPVFTITDLLPHLDRKVQRSKRVGEAFPAEKLNLLAASQPLGTKDDKDRLRLAILNILYQRWGLLEEDLISSELEIVPAGKARDVGLDASMIGAYGHDDRSATFCALNAFLAVDKPTRPSLFIIYDKEEIGSYGSTGASGKFIEELVGLVFKSQNKEASWYSVQKSLANTKAISADVEGALDPDFPEVHDKLNAALIGCGPCLVRYTGGSGKGGASEARAEFMAFMRRIFSENNICWQSTLLGRQEEGGGGTVALYLATYGMEIVDFGPALLSMHSPFEIISKADLYMTKKAYQAFYQSF